MQDAEVGNGAVAVDNGRHPAIPSKTRSCYFQLLRGNREETLEALCHKGCFFCFFCYFIIIYIDRIEKNEFLHPTFIPTKIPKLLFYI